MPQISKIRIVNFTYNDGNRFIPDELYDLSSPESGKALNALFNLNNGGGKTVLVQLMMQPVHPRAMAGGRRIEDYFVRPGDHTFILLEWNLDGSREKLLTGISMAASAGNFNEESQRGNRIKYYTFKTIYEKHSPYSIASLELSANENGKYVPAPFDFVREKAKASRGALEYYSSDDAVRWAEMLSEEYGIHRAEWETVIEALNRDEGGLNQYFNEARTSDRLIAKFFIPAIEHRLMSAASRGTDSSLETMLINYARRITDKETVIRERDTNNKLLGDLAEIRGMTEVLCQANEGLLAEISQAMGFKAALSRRIFEIKAELDAVGRQIEDRKKVIVHIEHEERSKDYYTAGEKYEKAKAALEEVDGLLKKCRAELEKKKQEEDLLQCAGLYLQIKEADGKIKELKKLIEEKENNSEDAERIASLKYSVFVKAKSEGEALGRKASGLKEGIEKKTKALNLAGETRKRSETELSQAEGRYIKADSDLEAAKGNTDERMKTLGIEAGRRLDGFYPLEEVESEKAQRLQTKEKLELRAQDTKKRIDEIGNRQGEIPAEKAGIQIKANETAGRIEKAGEELREYDFLYEKLIKICDRYSLDSQAVFSGTLRGTLQKEIDFTEAGISAAGRERQAAVDKKKAAEEGSLHILPEIMEYVRSTGIPCLTGEEYICGLTEDGKLSDKEAEKILRAYPELAYSLLFNTQTEIQRLLSAGNIDWLPAALPLFTMEEAGRIFDGSMEPSAFLAVCDRSFFADREGYIGRLAGQMARLEERLKYLKSHLEEVRAEKSVADTFTYPEGWREDQKKLISSLKQEQEELQAGLLELDRESQVLRRELTEKNEILEGIRKEIQETDLWLSSFSELAGMLSREKELFDDLQKISVERKRAQEAHKKACAEYEICENALAALRTEQEENSISLERKRYIMSQVDRAGESALIEGELEQLFTRYNTLLISQSKSLEGLKNSLDTEQEKKDSAQKELAGYTCRESEFISLAFSPDALQRVKRERKGLEEDRERVQTVYNEKNGEYIRAEEGFRQAGESLADYGGIPLLQGEIGDSFKERIQEANLVIRSLNEKTGKLDGEERALERVSVRAENVLEAYTAGDIVAPVVLNEKPDEQWKKIKEGLDRCSKEYSVRRDVLNKRLRDTSAAYRDSVLTEIIGKLDLVGDMIGDAGSKGSRLYTAGESISAMIASIEKINSSIETDLKEIENDFHDIVNQCFWQGKRMYTDLRMIAASSRAHIFDGKPQIQMVKMDLPEEKEISEEASRAAIRSEIEQGANELKELIKTGAEDKQILKRAKVIVGSERLLHRYIRMETISVRVYKIDLNRANSSYKKWEDTLTQSSGAEKFVAFFSVVLTLMNYTRSSSGLAGQKAKSVLILDNPFGKITSAHLLKPMFDIARHFDVQLICLSDINKSDVISCFDCVIKLLIKTQNLSSFEIMTHEGNERIEHGYYKIMNGQLSLF